MPSAERAERAAALPQGRTGRPPIAGTAGDAEAWLLNVREWAFLPTSVSGVSGVSGVPGVPGVLRARPQRVCTERGEPTYDACVQAVPRVVVRQKGGGRRFRRVGGRCWG